MLVTLKKATVADIPVLLELEKSVAGTKIYSPMLEESEWAEALQNGAVILIEKGNTVVGNISYEKKRESHIYISGLVIAPQFQGQGIAREVMMQLLKKFKSTKRIDLVTHPDNKAALRLYQSFGFIVESR